MTVLRGSDAAAIEQAASQLAGGGLVAFPTETVYGLGARADADDAVAGIFAAKGRPSEHPLIVHVADANAASAFAARLTDTAQRLMAAFWPGPLTVVVPRRADVAAAAAGGWPTVALRCPDHAVAQALLRRAHALGVPGVAAPSANRFGRVSPTCADHVQREFGPELMVLDGGACREGIESTIVDCSRGAPVLLRPGTVTIAAIEAVLGQPLQARDAAAPRASGDLESHYAPTAEVRLAPAAELPAAVRGAVAQWGPLAVGVYSRAAPLPFDMTRFIAMPDNAAAMAHELYAVLRRLDALGVRQIWVETPADQPGWEGVRDRLQRSAAPR
jgi:L-threonylcarbamoyladenylate synthase